jgi:CheY-like chemotaxis protein
MPNFLIVSESKSFLTLAVKEHLRILAYRVVLVRADTDTVNNFKEQINGLLIFADEELIKQQQALTYIKDRAVTDGFPLFALGSRDEITAIKKIIPAHHINGEFVRPIHMQVSKLAETIDYVVKNYNTQKRILIINESVEAIRKVQERLAEKYNVYWANTGVTAIKYLTLSRPDLILLDYIMPVLDGKQLLEMIRSEAEFNGIPVIFLTDKMDMESVLSVRSLKPDGYLSIKQTPAQIVKAINHFLEKRKGSGYS